MAIREDLVASAVSFLQDPSVVNSPIENRIAFLQSKNLTQEEVDAALARAGSDTTNNYPAYASSQQVNRQPHLAYGNPPQYPWQSSPPPELPRRDWRDWFIMATVMGGVGYGMYVVAKRHIYPMIAPPTAPQLEQDKKSIDDSFEKAFALLDQLAQDTDALKASEQTRTERLDAALTEVEVVINELKTSSRRREEESRRIGDEVRGLRDLIPKAIDGQKETTDNRLKELNTELKSLKTLMGQRMNPAPPVSVNSYGRPPSVGTSSGGPVGNAATYNSSNNVNTVSSTEGTSPRPATVSSSSGTEAVASIQGRTSSPFNTVAPSSRAAIPAWQLAAANKTSGPTSTAASSINNADVNDAA